jgi:hypothetical protein
MTARIEARPTHATDHDMCTLEGDPDPPQASAPGREPAADGVEGVDRAACRRAVIEETIADVACLGSAVWTVGSLPSIVGAAGGAAATAAACTYAGLKSADADEVCGRAAEALTPALTWSSDSS